MYTNRYWRTDDLYLAAFLFAKGVILTGIDISKRRADFAFADSFQRELWHEEYEDGKPMINVHMFAAALETLRQKRIDARMQFDGRSQS